jgi:hypothetical protein
MKIIANLFFILTFFQITKAQNNIIPKPVSFENNKEFLDIGSELKFNILTKDEQSIRYINTFKKIIEKTGIKVVYKKSIKNALIISLNKL